MAETTSVLYEVERGRARITPNRPEKRNALGLEVLTLLRDSLSETDDDLRDEQGRLPGT